MHDERHRNILKERKKARDERETAKEPNQPPLLQQAKINVTKQTARKTARSVAKRPLTNDADTSPMSEYRRSWKVSLLELLLHLELM